MILQFPQDHCYTAVFVNSPCGKLCRSRARISIFTQHVLQSTWRCNLQWVLSCSLHMAEEWDPKISSRKISGWPLQSEKKLQKILADPSNLQPNVLDEDFSPSHPRSSGKLGSVLQRPPLRHGRPPLQVRRVTTSRTSRLETLRGQRLGLFGKTKHLLN